MKTPTRSPADVAQDPFPKARTKDGAKVRAEITTNGETVWVNAAHGAIGRFGPLGVDIHNTENNGCRGCFGNLAGTTRQDWGRFVALMQEHHQIKIAERHMPARLRQRDHGVTARHCASCGACCVNAHDYGDESEVDLLALDVERLSAEEQRSLTVDRRVMRARRRLIILREDGITKKTTALVCAALEGYVGESCSCQIYDHRPYVCRRAVQPGDENCISARARIGI